MATKKIHYAILGPNTVRFMVEELTLEKSQEIVEGWIEMVYTRFPRLALFVNDNGIAQSLPLNPTATAIAGQPVVGSVVVFGASKGEKEGSLSKADEDLIQSMFWEFRTEGDIMQFLVRE